MWICFVIAVVNVYEDGYGADSEAIKDMLSEGNSQIAIEEEGYLAEQNIQTQVKEKSLSFVSIKVTSLLQIPFANLFIPCFTHSVRRSNWD